MNKYIKLKSFNSIGYVYINTTHITAIEDNSGICTIHTTGGQKFSTQDSYPAILEKINSKEV